MEKMLSRYALDRSRLKRKIRIDAMLESFKQPAINSQYRPMTIERVLIAIARLQDGDQIAPCYSAIQNPVTREVEILGRKQWRDCITQDNGMAFLWYNHKNNSTKIAALQIGA